MVAKTTGVTLGISSTLPATYDATGYGVLTYSAIGEVTDIGELSKAFNVITHQAIALGYPTKLKGNYDIGNITVTVGRIVADAGQIAVQSALNSDASVAFKVTLPSGNTGEFTGKVIKAGTAAIANESVEGTVIEIAVDPQSLLEA